MLNYVARRPSPVPRNDVGRRPSPVPRNLVGAIAEIIGANRDVDDPRREARTIAQFVNDEWAARAAAERRAAGAPLAYAVGRAAFRHIELDVDERVLIPRPETEIVVDVALQLCRTGVAVDVGTGSGAIALSLATEGQFDRVIATDVSADALEVARENVCRLGTRVEFRVGSFLAPVAGVQADLIVANPPYIADAEMPSLPAAVRDWEPSVALAAGRDGLGPSRRIVRDAVSVLRPGGWLVLETDSTRAGALAEVIRNAGGYDEVEIHRDLTGRERVVSARRT